VKALTGVAVAVALMLAPAAAEAQLPVGEAHGVKVTRERGALVVIFKPKAAKLYKRIAGKLVQVHCTELTEEGSNGGGETLRAPLRGRKLVTGDLTRGLDYCRIWIAPRTITRKGERHRLGRQLVVSVPLTQKGAVHLDEEAKTIEMLSLGAVAALVMERQKLSGYPSYDQLIDVFPKLARRVVPLAAPGDTPPAGKAGWYSDGLEHVATVVVSASGRRPFIETAADDVLSTNVAQYIFGDLD
jgi:hypothetical protein